MLNKTIDYAIFKQAGFDEKVCSLSYIDIPNLERSTIQDVHLTSSATRLRYHVKDQKDIVNFKVEFIPYEEGGEQLLEKAFELVKNVLKVKYQSEPFTLASYEPNTGKLINSATIHINNTIIQKVALRINRKNDKEGEPGFVRIIFALQGLITAPKSK